jgi:hypothetical protein
LWLLLWLGIFPWRLSGFGVPARPWSSSAGNGPADTLLNWLVEIGRFAVVEQSAQSLGLRISWVL